MRIAATFLMTVGFFALPSGATQPSNYLGSNYDLVGLTPRTVVDEVRFYDVLESQRSVALEMLATANSKAIELADAKAAAFIGSTPDMTSVLSQLSDVIGLQITKREQRRKNERLVLAQLGRPESSAGSQMGNESNRLRSSIEQFEAYSTLEKNHAAHVLTLRGRLKPFLVSLAGRNRSAGMYYGWWRGDKLIVVNTIYGEGPEMQKPFPVIVYLEQKPREIEEQQSYVEVRSGTVQSTDTK